MKFTLNSTEHNFVFFLYEMENSPIEATPCYSDECITLQTYTVKDTSKNNIMGYRVDFVKKDYKVSGINNKMVNVFFGNSTSITETNPLTVIFDDVNFRIISYGTSQIYSIILKKTFEETNN